ncbi:MAG: hypothetical protein DMF72_21450 [Acidobacteria bacterium]|nr:MAG: hypothetical protein DMF72_21450 [Acidobacteriota bacterium]
MQVIAAAEWVELAVIDLSGFGEEEREAAGLRLAQEEAQRPFDLARGPLLRVSLLRLAEQEHIALLTMHHIISDGWSVGVMIREVAALYEAYVGGGTSPLAELPIQYADYAVWQREWLSGSVLDEQLAYWKQQLGGELPVLELPTDYARPALQSFEGGREHLSLPAELSEGLRAVSRSEGVTLFMTLLTLWQVLLSRWSGQDDVIVGVPIAGRTQVEVEGLIGFFVNTLPLRADLRGEPSFRELLRRVREVTLGAYANQELPFEKLVEELQPERNLNRHPIFDVLFNFINTPQEALELSGLTISYPNLSAEDSKFAMTLYVEEQESSLDLSLAYRRDLFSQERMACLLSQYQNLLRQAVAAPEKLVQDYSLVTPESSYLLPDPTADLSEPQYRPVTEMFLDQADRAPASAAMQQGDHIWTYAELSEKAKAISGILLSSKLNAGDVVAVIGPRSFGLIASMLGVLLSRGVLLTIDTVFPVEFTAPPGSFDVMSVNPHQGVVESPKEYLDHQAFKPPEIAPDDPAYVFFTSGTTGIPMGVLGSHKGLGHFLTWQRATFEVGPEDRCAQLTGLSFDVVLRDIFLPLVSGATLCLPKAIDDLRAERIVPWLADERITLLHTVPSLAQSWLQHPGSRPSLQNLRLTFFAGEPLTDVLVHRWRAAFSQMGKIVNLYGPTETTLAKCFYVVPPDVTVGTQLVGAPLPQTQVLILSQNNRLCGIGEAGEIVIRTPFRSLGYVNPTQKDQRRFIKNPYRDDQHDLLYRTGDRGRYTLNGMVEILGRLDDQVKIRGQRIEPGEVEIVLSGHAGVQQAVVIVHEDELGDKRLVAYVVGQPLQLLTIDQLRRFLKERLPQHMVPSGFVMIDKLPLTPNGKVDRGALPSMSRAVRFESDSTYLAPRNSLEEVIAGIWGGVLKLERVGINDNFFAVGGHSLLAMHIIAQLREIFQVELPLRSLFEEPTIAGTAAVLLSDSQRQAKVEKTARLLMSLTHLSESEVEAMLDRKVSLQG